MPFFKCLLDCLSSSNVAILALVSFSPVHARLSFPGASRLVTPGRGSFISMNGSGTCACSATSQDVFSPPYMSPPSCCFFCFLRSLGCVRTSAHPPTHSNFHQRPVLQMQGLNQEKKEPESPKLPKMGPTKTCRCVAICRLHVPGHGTPRLLGVQQQDSHSPNIVPESHLKRFIGFMQFMFLFSKMLAKGCALPHSCPHLALLQCLNCRTASFSSEYRLANPRPPLKDSFVPTSRFLTSNTCLVAKAFG